MPDLSRSLRIQTACLIFWLCCLVASLVSAIHTAGLIAALWVLPHVFAAFTFGYVWRIRRYIRRVRETLEDRWRAK